MNLKELLATESRILGDGSMYELLRRHPDIEFDDHIAHAGLIYNDEFARVLERVARSYIDVAVAQALPMFTTTSTWRANRERVANSAFAEQRVNEDNARFFIDLRDSYVDSGISISIGGNIGPYGDAYKPEEALDTEAAREFHAWQLERLAESGVDFLMASTLPNVNEAMGIALAMNDTGKPFVISFVVDRNGCVFDGTRLNDAIHRIEDRIAHDNAHFAINCVHPAVLQSALQINPEIGDRIVAFSGNTSARSADELDELEELDTVEPEVFARAHRELLQTWPIPIVGGCCGTSPAHIEALARLDR